MLFMNTLMINFDAAVRDADKLRRDEHVAEVKAQAKEHFLELYPEMDMEIDYVLYKTLKVLYVI